MPGGGQVRVIKPWNLAAETLIYCAFGLGTLLVIFAVPEIFRAGMYFAYDVASNAKVNTLQWPGWALGFFELRAIGRHLHGNHSLHCVGRRPILDPQTSARTELSCFSSALGGRR